MRPSTCTCFRRFSSMYLLPSLPMPSTSERLLLSVRNFDDCTASAKSNSSCSWKSRVARPYSTGARLYFRMLYPNARRQSISRYKVLRSTFTPSSASFPIICGAVRPWSSSVSRSKMRARCNSFNLLATTSAMFAPIANAHALTWCNYILKKKTSVLRGVHTRMAARLRPFCFVSLPTCRRVHSLL